MSASETYVRFAMSDLGLSIDALAVTLANSKADGNSISDATLSIAGGDLFMAAKAGNVTASWGALLRVVRGVYEGNAMTPSMRLRVDNVAAELNRL